MSRRNITSERISLNMRIIPNPGVRIVQAISISLIFAHKLIGIDLGTVVAVLGVGRVISLFNHLFMKKMTAAAGVEY